MLCKHGLQLDSWSNPGSNTVLDDDWPNSGYRHRTLLAKGFFHDVKIAPALNLRHVETPRYLNAVRKASLGRQTAPQMGPEVSVSPRPLSPLRFAMHQSLGLLSLIAALTLSAAATAPARRKIVFDCSNIFSGCPSTFVSAGTAYTYQSGLFDVATQLYECTYSSAGSPLICEYDVGSSHLTISTFPQPT